MDSSERIVAEHLATIGFTDVKYEPDGNIPPDFLVNGRIAVEVRRLNQMESTQGRPRGLEEVDIPLQMKFQKLLASFGPPSAGQSWFILYDFSRPVEDWRTLRPKIANWLQSIRDTQPVGLQHAKFGTFELDAARASSPFDSEFLLGGISDMESGGWVLETLVTTLKVCIHEKSSKVSSFRHKYPEWWLVFVDHIAYHIDDTEFEGVRSSVPRAPSWDRIVLVNPLDPTKAMVLQPAAG